MTDARKDLPPVNSPNFLERVREALQTYLGNRGDRLDRGVTVRDLQDAGIITTTAGYTTASGKLTPISGPGSAIAGSSAQTSGSTDRRTPIAPTGFAASTQRGSIRVVTDAATFTTGNGYARTVIYGAKRGAADPTVVFANAVVLTDFVGTACTFPAEPAAIYQLWAVWVTADGVMSPPAGGTNGLSARVTAMDGDNITSLPFSKLASGALPAATVAQSTGYESGVAGWRYAGDGTAEFTGLVARSTTLEGVAAAGATGTGNLVFSISPTLTTPALGTPTALVGTNITGTAAGLTAGDVSSVYAWAKAATKPNYTYSEVGAQQAALGSGSVALVAGVATVSLATIGAGSLVFVQRQTDGGTLGVSYSITRTAGVSFTITARNGAGATETAETSTVGYQVF